MSKSRQTRPITPGYLEKAALSYLERFSASTASVRRVLMRRVKKAEADGAAGQDDFAAMVEAVLAKLARAGYLDDRRYAEAKAESLLRQGRPPSVIAKHLSARGVGTELVAEAVEALVADRAESGGNAELEAARAFAKRRRLGPYRMPGKGQDMREKDLASLGRAGFSWRIAKAVIDGAEE